MARKTFKHLTKKCQILTKRENTPLFSFLVTFFLQKKDESKHKLLNEVLFLITNSQKRVTLVVHHVALLER